MRAVTTTVNPKQPSRRLRCSMAILSEIRGVLGGIEPEEGKFDFTMVDALLASARRYGVKLILIGSLPGRVAIWTMLRRG